MFAGEGEPMLHPDIVGVTNHAAMAGLDVAFTTNGTALTQKFVDKALGSCKWIKVSLNGGPKTYASIHQTNEKDYERVWANLRQAVEGRRERGLSCTLGVQTVVLPENIAELPAIAGRARDTGLDYLVLKPYSQHKASGNRTHEEIKYGDVYSSQLDALASQYNEGTFKVIVRRDAMGDWDAGEHSYHTCHATPYFWAYVMATGDVYSCSAYLLNPEFCLGNVNEASFQAIWEGPRRQAHIEAMKTLDISKCRLNCRMNQVNKYLDEVKQPGNHVNFI